MSNKKVTIQNADGGLKSGSYFENAATNDVLESITGVLSDTKRQSQKQHEDATTTADENAKKDRQLIKENAAEQARREGGFVSSAFAAIGNISDIALRAYRQKVDLADDITSAVSALTNTFSAITSGLGTVATMFFPLGKAAKLANKGLTELANKGKDKDPIGIRRSKIKGELAAASDAFNKVTSGIGNFVEGGLKELISYHTTFREVSQVGASFGGDLLELKGAAGMARLEIGEFGKYIQQNADSFAGFGTDLSSGAKLFALNIDEFANNLEPAYSSLKQLGMTTEDINNQMLRQMRFDRRKNFEDAAVREQEQLAATRFSKELDLMARLTGQQREEIQKEIDRQRSLAEVEATIQQLDMNGAKGVGDAFDQAMKTVQQFGPGAQAAFREIFAQGTVYTEDGMQAFAAMGSAGDELMQLALRVRQGGDVSDVSADLGGAMVERIRQEDFLSLSKLGVVGSDVGQAAGSILTSGLNLADAIYKVEQDFPELTSGEAYEKALELAKEAQEKQINEADTTGKALNKMFNNLESGLENVGSALNQQMVNSINVVSGSLIGFDMSLHGAIDGLAEMTKSGADGLAEMIRPDKRLFETLTAEQKKALIAGNAEALKEFNEKKIALEKEEAKKRHEAFMSQNPFERQSATIAEQQKEQQKITTQVKSDLEVVTDKLTEFTDNAFAKIGVDSAAIRKDMMTAMGEWKADSKAWLEEAGIDVDTISGHLESLNAGIKWVSEILTDLAKAVLTWIGIDVEKLGAKIGEGLDWANIKAGSLYSEGKEAISTIVDAATGDKEAQQEMSDAVEGVFGPLPSAVGEATKNGIVEGWKYLQNGFNNIVGSSSTESTAGDPALPVVTPETRVTPVSIQSIAPSAATITPPASTQTRVEATAGEKDFESLAQQEQLDRIEQNYLAFTTAQYSILEELKTLNTSATHGNDISDYQARQQIQTNSKLGSLKSNRNDIHAVLQ